ncbi:nucleotide exchange factor GrpE [Acidaminobacter hydrogenoformans]|uniref:Protein GrpE n=1 Tax=Acidaminobacter hydrogenoformans DSM 2784 TaxID=1120920 RepID=A0A1G5RT51_9FIRM|nr:nucleotide exchange factor GrpE [Acidaminobacter hydrogenoformans]SCZ77166.1 molecular chaperone GrpE [Acidaminobacter hydrogenoformans DSM 2784]
MKKQTHKEHEAAEPTQDSTQNRPEAADTNQSNTVADGFENNIKAEETASPVDEEKLATDKELKRLTDEIAAKSDAFLRLTAEYQNYRRRVEKEKQELIKFGNEKLVVDLLKVLDNFDRALSTVDYDCEENKNLVSGIEMIRKSLSDLLKDYGVSPIEAVGQTFDPELHHAVMTEAAEGVAPDTVLDEFQKGYTLHQKVVRHSMVKVSAHG